MRRSLAIELRQYKTWANSLNYYIMHSDKKPGFHLICEQQPSIFVKNAVSGHYG
jgi:hypothetical protein